jgi:hypothetical protein
MRPNSIRKFFPLGSVPLIAAGRSVSSSIRELGEALPAVVSITAASDRTTVAIRTP